jgi:hypothetical protein
MNEPKEKTFFFFRHFARGEEEEIKLYNVDRMENLILFIYQDHELKTAMSNEAVCGITGASECWE